MKDISIKKRTVLCSWCCTVMSHRLIGHPPCEYSMQPLLLILIESKYLLCNVSIVTSCPTPMSVIVTWPGWVSGWRRPEWWAEILAVRSLPSSRRSPSRMLQPLISHVMVSLQVPLPFSDTRGLILVLMNGMTKPVSFMPACVFEW